MVTYICWVTAGFKVWGWGGGKRLSGYVHMYNTYYIIMHTINSKYLGGNSG